MSDALRKWTMLAVTSRLYESMAAKLKEVGTSRTPSTFLSINVPGVVYLHYLCAGGTGEIR
jgi:hypothetical protein